MGEKFQIAVKAGEDLREKIAAFLREKQWTSAYISGAIGSVIDVQYVVPVDYPTTLEVVTCRQGAELLSFTGELLPRELVPPALKVLFAEEFAAHEEPWFLHIHASAAVSGGHVYGGGFLGGRALRAVNVFIQEGYPVYR